MKKKVIFIGSGFGALAGAALLAKEGYDVTVLEKNEQLGGRASVFEADGFRFDMGPSWYLMPDIFEKFFAEFDRKPTDFFELLPLEPQYRNYFADGSIYDVTKNVEETIAYFESVEQGAGKKLREYLVNAEQKYEISLDHFLYKNIDNLLQFFNTRLLRPDLTLSMMTTMEKYVYSRFKDLKLRQLLTYSLVFLGCSPKNAPAVFSLMAHVDFKGNVFYPKGGMSAVVESFVSLGKEYGVTYITNAAVKNLKVGSQSATRSSVITAIETDTHTYQADIIVSNAEYAHTESLMDDQKYRQYTDSYWKKKVFSPSAFLMYLGIKEKVPEILHHTFIFSEEYDKQYVQVFESPQWPDNPSIYINKPSATDPHVAPKGHENMMVLVPVAPGLFETEESKNEYAELLFRYIQKRTGVDLKSKVTYQRLFSVSDFSQRYNAYSGNAFSGLANTFFQSTLFRQSNKHKKIANLYFVGVNTQPGVGVPPAIISGHLLRDRLKELDNKNGA